MRVKNIYSFLSISKGRTCTFNPQLTLHFFFFFFSARCYKKEINYPGLELPKEEYFSDRTIFEIICEEGYEKTSSKNKIRCLKGTWDVDSNPCTIRDQSIFIITHIVRNGFFPILKIVFYENMWTSEYLSVQKPH